MKSYANLSVCSVSVITNVSWVRVEKDFPGKCFPLPSLVAQCTLLSKYDIAYNETSGLLAQGLDRGTIISKTNRILAPYHRVCVTRGEVFRTNLTLILKLRVRIKNSKSIR